MSECSLFNTSGKLEFCSDKRIIEKLKQKTNSANLNELKQKTNCQTEKCMYKSPLVISVIGEKEAEYQSLKNFKVKGPYNTTEWLNNDHIDNILYQAAEFMPVFHHIKFQMIDFEETRTELSNLDIISKYKKGYKYIGVILNTDKSTGKGEHWFAIFIKMMPNSSQTSSNRVQTSDNPSSVTIEYFNSSGNDPRKEVTKWMVKQKYLLISKGIRVNIIHVCKYQIQYSATECGCFSLFYIYSRLNGISTDHFNRSHEAISDDVMVKFRKKLFGPE